MKSVEAVTHTTHDTNIRNNGMSCYHSNMKKKLYEPFKTSPVLINVNPKMSRSKDNHDNKMKNNKKIKVGESVWTEKRKIKIIERQRQNNGMKEKMADYILFPIKNPKVWEKYKDI